MSLSTPSAVLEQTGQGGGPSSDSETAKTKPAVASTSLYQLVWRWHFYAGLLIAPTLWIVTLTGAIYVFRTELTEFRDHALLFVTPTDQRLGYEELRQIATKHAGENEIEAMAISPDPARSVQFVAHVHAEGDAHDHAAEKHQRIAVNPYSGEVLGDWMMEDDFFAIVLQLHRNLLMGTTGRVLTELTTSWGLLLLATGTFLWWPRGKRNVGVWAPRIRGAWYAVLRDWHAVSGAYLAPIMAIVTATGLVFSVVVGLTFNTTAQKIGHWPMNWFMAPSVPAPTTAAPPASLDQVVPVILAQSRPDDEVAIRFPEKPDMAVRAYLMRDEDKNSLRAVSVNPYTAELIEVIDPPELPLMYRVRLWAVSIHMGQIFGTPTKILALISSLVMFGLSVTGLWMWWKRRPANRSGFPRRPLSGSLPRWGAVVILACGILLPVAGASILLVAVLDRLVFNRRRPVSPRTS